MSLLLPLWQVVRGEEHKRRHQNGIRHANKLHIITTCHHCAKKYHLNRSGGSLPVSDTVSSLKSDTPPSEPFIYEEAVEHTSNCEFMLKIYHLPSFWKSLSSTKLTPTHSPIYSLKPGFLIIAPVAIVANKITQRQERFLGFHIIATIAT